MAPDPEAPQPIPNLWFPPFTGITGLGKSDHRCPASSTPWAHTGPWARCWGGDGKLKARVSWPGLQHRGFPGGSPTRYLRGSPASVSVLSGLP